MTETYKRGDLETQIRLEKIEKELKSIGSLLDTRHPYAIEKAVIPKNALKKKDKVKQRQAAEAAAMEEAAAAKSEETRLAEELAERKRLKYYEEETLMWKTKSTAPTYLSLIHI